ncbi:MAG: oxygen-dependent coproporphyrinogen oxidase [Bacteroidetes bacterium]|nr:oxygen-dependent coproporphyrinogen oxidase [Bacteroidota bacterium]MDA1121543.1 oxygen-dependent coproporphyrinogen oxidase [Bacteroidota bacterium]
MNKESISRWFRNLQLAICNSLEILDREEKFLEDEWTRSGGGGGYSSVISNGNLLEKGGVNYSQVHGETPQKILEALQLKESMFYATGVSIVLHPKNPHVPIIHMNVRYFEMSDGTWWFGGGIDLTPIYISEKQASFFHKELKKACDNHDSSYYQKFKTWADDYFYIKHRNETRGIGGIFFDRLAGKDNDSKERIFEFVKEIGNSLVPVYSAIAEENRSIPFDESQREWQYLRRGRYTEFNLVYDKGTKFGLDTNGRTESILMSLPPQANWKYDFHPREGTPEWLTQSLLLKGIDWINR